MSGYGDEDGGYRGGGTIGGRWGCAAATLIGAPLSFALLLIEALGDCAESMDCKTGFVVGVVLHTVLVAVPLGLLVRYLLNRYAR